MLRAAALAALAALLGSAPHRPAPHPDASLAQGGPPFRLVFAPTGNEARWRVRERLVSFDFPNDAVGVTHDVAGAIVVGAGWQPDSAASKITVNLTTLKSDRAMRDRYVQRRILETEQFPTATLVPTRFLRLRTPVPDTGTFTFEIAGNLTVHGVTKPSTWLVTAVAKDGGYTGTAMTRVRFEDFRMQQPRVPILLSIEDEINLELQFTFVRDAGYHG
jgi:polyisoprenoid-binding protein YceI